MLTQSTKLTDRQQHTLEAIKAYRMKNGVSPTIPELRTLLNLRSFRSVTQRLEQLEKKGFLRRTPFQHRGIILIDPSGAQTPGQTIRVPVIASAGCDQMQVIAEETYSEYITIDPALRGSAHDVFAVKAVGNSMVDAGIKNGDYVLVDAAEGYAPVNNDRVVAIIGEYAVIKRWKKIPGMIILEPESKEGGYSPIILKEDFQVFGKVLNVIPAAESIDEDAWTWSNK